MPLKIYVIDLSGLRSLSFEVSERFSTSHVPFHHSSNFTSFAILENPDSAILFEKKINLFQSLLCRFLCIK